jgi:O-antigen/teichoic acid export membrane protein
MFPVIKERGEKLEKEQLEKEQQHRMFKNVRDLFITNVSSILVNATDNLIITAISGLATTGLNSNYSLMSQTLTGFTTRIQNGVCASIGNVVAVEDDKHKLELFDEIFFGFFWMYFWCALCYSLLINDVIKICFGAKYVMPFSIAVITGVNLYTLEMKSAIGIFKGTMGLFKYGKYTVFATGVINIIFSIILGKKWGVFGVLLATFVANMLTVKWYFPYVTFKYGFHTSAMHYFKRDIRYWIEVIIFSCATHYICEAITLPIWLDLIYRAIICIIVPNMLIILFHRRER